MNLLERFAASRDRPLIDNWTYGQIWGNGWELACEWENVGLRRGDRVIFNFRNDPAFLACYIACAIGGFTACPVATTLTQDTIQKIIRLVKPALVYRDPPKLKETTHSPVVHSVKHEGIFSIIFTSGTTGEPKGICFSLESVLGIAEAFAKHSGMTESTEMHHVLPMAFNAGFINTMLAPMMAGGSIIVDPFQAFKARDFDWKGNALVLTPTMAAALCRYTRDRATSRDSAKHVKIHCTAGQLTSGLRNQFNTIFGVPLRDCYGITELGGPLTLQKSDGDDCGEPLPELSFRVLPGWQDQDGGHGTDQLWVKSPYMMVGYLTETGLEMPTLWDGHFPTGDVGVTENGVLKITGRVKDMIVRGGVNVSPLAVENVISEVQEVSEVAVVGVNHEVWGEVIVACVIPRVTDLTGLQDQIHRHCVDRLSLAERPDRIVIMHEFPRSNGKPKKDTLRQYAQALDG